MTSNKQDTFYKSTIDSLVNSPQSLSATSQTLSKSNTPNNVKNFMETSLDKNFLFLIIGFLVIVIIIILFVIFGGVNFLGATVGDSINFIADTITDLGTQGLNIMDGSVHDITKFILPVSEQPNSSNSVVQPTAVSSPVPTTSIPTGNVKTPSPSPPIMPIATQPIPQPPSQQNPNNVQPSNPPSTLASNWCVVGQTNGVNACVPVSNSQQCMSGLVFPTLENCLIPNPPPIKSSN